MEPSAAVEEFRRRVSLLKDEMGKVIVGQEMIVEGVVICLCAGGHVLLEGVPGLGKTLLVRSLAQCLGLDFGRIQFTPDLMPADVTGTNIIAESPEGRREFSFQRGPVFTNILLADEINRATPKTQSALLEAMQEKSVTVAGTTYTLDEPYIVLATQNPLEMEGTYPLPEAQLDRFLFKLKVFFPSLEEMIEIMNRTTSAHTATLRPVLGRDDILMLRRLVREVPMAPHVLEHAVKLTLATHPESEFASPEVRKYVRYGASPRGAQALTLAAKVRALLHGRFHASIEDVEMVSLPALRHRAVLNFEAQADEVEADSLIAGLLEALSPSPHVPSAGPPSVR
jgi:MoxR-like ATPase